MNNKDCRQQFDEEQLKAIEATWLEQPPRDCKGKCKLNTATSLGILYCEGCGWNDEDHFPQV